MERVILSNNTLIPISMALVLVGAVFSFGIMYEKVDYLSTQQKQIQGQLSVLSSKVDQFIGLNQISFNH